MRGPLTGSDFSTFVMPLALEKISRKLLPDYFFFSYCPLQILALKTCSQDIPKLLQQVA